MPKTSHTRVLNVPAEKIFQAVMDIESYPQLLHFIRSVKILEQHPNEMKSRISVGMPGFSFDYECLIQSEPHRSIHVTLLSGPFEHLNAHWEFEALDHSTTRVSYFLDSKFGNPLVELTAGALLASQIHASVRAFERALKIP